MVAINVRLNLPDELARQAEERGLLRPEQLERMLRSELLNAPSSNTLDELLARVAESPGTPMSDEEIVEEIHEVRRERRERDARRP